MATSRDTFESVIYVNNEQAQDAIAAMTKELNKNAKAYEKLLNTEGATKKELKAAEKAWKDSKQSLENVKQGVDNYRKALDNLNEQSIGKLVKMQRLLESELKKTKPDTKEWKELAEQYQNVTKRISSLKTAYKEVGEKQSGLLATLNKLQGAWVVGIGVIGKVGAALKGVAKFTNHVIHSSQTMGDAWDNAVTAMKTTTEAFFVALSTGNWDAFNGGLREAIKNAKEYAAALDKLESRRISNEYVKSEYLTNYREDMVTANDKSQDEATRRAALESAKSNLGEYLNSINKLGADTKKKLVASYKALYGIDYTGDELGFDQFFDELYKNVIVDENETVNKMSARLNELKSKARAELTEGWSSLNYQGGASQWVNEEAEKKAMEEMRKEYSELQMNLWKGHEIVDEQLKADLADFKQYKDAIREASRYQKQLNTEDASFSAQVEADKAAAAKQALEEKKAAAEAAYQTQMKHLEKERYANQQHYAEMYMKGEIDKKAYDAQMIVLEDAYLAEKLALNQRYGKDTDSISQTILDRQIKRYEEAKKTIKTLMDDEANFDPNWEMKEPDDDEKEEERARRREELRKKAEEEEEARLAPILQKAEEIRASIQETSLRSEYETEMAWIEKLHEKKMLSEEEYEAAKLKLRIDYAGKAAQKTNEILGAAADLSAAIQSAETANLEAEYQARLTAAGDNAEQRETIEAEYEQKKLDMKKKYADADMVINIAKTIAAGALAVMQAFAQLGPIGGAVAAVLVGATTAAEVATIIAQRNAIKSQTVSMPTSSASAAGDFSAETSGGNIGSRVVTGYAKGGYTEGHTTLTTVGERGTEWIAPHWMVKQNPVTFANLERYRLSGSHGRSGSVARGFADGGYTPGAEGGENGLAAQLAATLSANTEASNRLASLIEKGLHAYVVLSELNQAQDKQNRFNEKTSR